MQDHDTTFRAQSAISAYTGSVSRFERAPVLIFDNSQQLALQVARKVANLIQARQAVGGSVVLGLPTGSTPIGVYRILVKMHREEGLDFSNVITFNLDEYFPMKPTELQSYHRFMRENLFDHVNIPPENINIPRGDLRADEVERHCDEYELKIKKAGGIDLLLLGIGRSGHIGFNEPGSARDDRTRLVVLDTITRRDAASDFFDEKHVPREAITMGVGTILEAREIILIATGEHKAPIIRRAVEQPQNSSVTASFLQQHPNAAFYLDKASAGRLTREETPWLVRKCVWDEALKKRAVIWLSEKEKTAILRLEEADFHRNHLHDLVYSTDDVDKVCQRVFDDLRDRIVYASDLPIKKKCIVFSPHPDDDVISMGGMLAQLVENGNDVVVAYMTNGSVSVFDQDLRRHLRFMGMTQSLLNPDEGDETSRIPELVRFLDEKKPGQVDSPEIQQIKAYIRYTEAIAGLEVMGLEDRHVRFLDLPFYKTGEVKKDPISLADVEIISDLFDSERPDHIFVAGDLSDPHGTHRMCYKAIRESLEQIPSRNSSNGAKPATDIPVIWLYRGAWQEWEIDRATHFLPMSKADLDRKIEAIYKHESQKDRAAFPGSDEREFWERARDRNRGTAESLDKLGLPEFFAVEAYVVVDQMP